MALVIGLMLLASLGLVVGTAMTSSTTVFAGALVLAVVFAAILALALEDVGVSPELQDDVAAPEGPPHQRHDCQWM